MVLNMIDSVPIVLSCKKSTSINQFIYIMSVFLYIQYYNVSNSSFIWIACSISKIIQHYLDCACIIPIIN